MKFSVYSECCFLNETCILNCICTCYFCHRTQQFIYNLLQYISWSNFTEGLFIRGFEDLTTCPIASPVRDCYPLITKVVKGNHLIWDEAVSFLWNITLKKCSFKPILVNILQSLFYCAVLIFDSNIAAALAWDWKYFAWNKYLSFFRINADSHDIYPLILHQMGFIYGIYIGFARLAVVKLWKHFGDVKWLVYQSHEVQLESYWRHAIDTDPRLLSNL